MAARTSLFLKAIAFGLALIVGLGLLVLFGFGSNEVQSKYETLSAAEQDRLFERGWLPEILPPSAEKIVTRNDLDLNTSSGEFYFKSEHWADFQKHLAPDSKSSTTWYFKEDGSTWTFDCKSNEGYCRYVLSPDPHV